MATSKGKCEIPQCDRDAEIRSLCKRCYSSLNYWRKKTPTQMMQRQQNLRLWDNRMSQMTNTRVIGRKASPRRKKRRRVA